MNSSDPRLLTFSSAGRGWLARVLFGALGLMAAVAAFFFLTVALVAGALLVLVLAVRWWWALRRIRAQQQASAALEGEYTVLRDSEARPQRLER